MQTKHLVLILLCVFLGPPLLLCGGCLMLAVVQPVIAPTVDAPPPGPEREAPRATTEEEKQKLAETYEALIGMKIVHRIDARNCYVLPGWHSTTLDGKNNFAAAAWSVANNCPDTIAAVGTDIGNRRLIILDARDGKRLGSYCPDFGLDLD